MVNFEGITAFFILMMVNVVYIKFVSGFTWTEMLKGLKKVPND